MEEGLPRGDGDVPPPGHQGGRAASADAGTRHDFRLWRSAVGGAPRQQFGSCALSPRRRGAEGRRAQRGPRTQDGAVGRLPGRKGTLRAAFGSEARSRPGLCAHSSPGLGTPSSWTDIPPAVPRSRGASTAGTHPPKRSAAGARPHPLRAQPRDGAHSPSAPRRPPALPVSSHPAPPPRSSETHGDTKLAPALRSPAAAVAERTGGGGPVRVFR